MTGLYCEIKTYLFVVLVAFVEIFLIGVFFGKMIRSVHYGLVIGILFLVDSRDIEGPI